ncbi:MAG: hypothetical protein ABIJ96_13910 [Elusimicrobiota bacterium]
MKRLLSLLASLTVAFPNFSSAAVNAVRPVLHPGGAANAAVAGAVPTHISISVTASALQPGTGLALPSVLTPSPTLNSALPAMKIQNADKSIAFAAPAKEEVAGHPVLWTNAAPSSQAKTQYRRAQWETFKFFFGSRVALLRQWVKEQELETKGKERAVADLEGMWTAWRVKGYTGGVQTAGFTTADRKTVRREAEKVYDKYFPQDPETRKAFHNYLDRVDAYVSPLRPSNYRKHAFGIFFETVTKTPREVKAYIEAKLGRAEVEKVERHRAEKQAAVVASFKEAVNKSILEVNVRLPQGKKIVALILLGSYAIGESTPKSDIDYQLVTQDGSLDAIMPFTEVLDRTWVENKLDVIEAFQFTLTPSPEVVRESFLEGYQVVSPDPAAVQALTFPVRPHEPTAWLKLRGKLFEWGYAAWVWAWFRAADIRDYLAE